MRPLLGLLFPHLSSAATAGQNTFHSVSFEACPCVVGAMQRLCGCQWGQLPKRHGYWCWRPVAYDGPEVVKLGCLPCRLYSGVVI
ncbi:hypothetical protein C8R43DRAFT_1047531 [Mycena crocata]|nr:hypothetical protein C8R43DRAFT_1047531 [Mycena crocata]